jgi:hypothetical protein
VLPFSVRRVHCGRLAVTSAWMTVGDKNYVTNMQAMNSFASFKPPIHANSRWPPVANLYLSI